MTYLALIISVLAGALLALVIKPQKQLMQLLLAFSGAYLLGATVLHLIPDVFSTENHSIGLFVLLGIVIQTILEFFSKGAEHGHVHINKEKSNVPWLLLVSLGLHALLEGMPLNNNNSDLLWAIVIHKVPIAIILTTFFIQANIKNSKAVLLLLVFALMSPLGNFISQHFDMISKYSAELNALIIGVFLHVSNAILFESTQNHQFNLRKFLAILVGFVLAML